MAVYSPIVSLDGGEGVSKIRRDCDRVGVQDTSSHWPTRSVGIVTMLVCKIVIWPTPAEIALPLPEGSPTEPLPQPGCDRQWALCIPAKEKTSVSVHPPVFHS